MICLHALLFIQQASRRKSTDNEELSRRNSVRDQTQWETIRQDTRAKPCEYHGNET